MSDTIVDLYRQGVARHRDARFALVHRDGAWQPVTFADLDRQVRAIAAGLIGLGVRRGDRVAVLCGTRLEWTACDFAVLMAGATTIPVYPSNSAAECLHVLRDAGCRVVIVENEEQLAKVHAVQAALPGLEHVIVVDGHGGMPLAALIEAGESHIDAVDARADSVSPDDPCTFVYTSGTTGPPKGCVILHRQYRVMMDMVRTAHGILDEGLCYLYLPLAHVFARAVQFWCVAEGVTLAYTRGVQHIVDDLGEVRPTALPSVPRVFEKVHTGVLGAAAASSPIRRRLFGWAIGIGTEVSKLREQGREPGGWLARRHALADRLVLHKVRARLGGELRVCISGGAPVSPEVLRFFHACGILVLEGYGMTESSTAISINRPDRFRFGSVGIPFEGGEVRIADDGEILYRGPNVFAGYHGLPDATAETIIDGWLHTGDIGDVDADGFLHITDRKKDLIITAGGKNVAPANLENALKLSPLISEACVIGDRRPYLVALLTLDPDELARMARERGIAEPAMAEDPAVARIVDEQVELVNADLAKVEQIKRTRILPVQFSQETGELTPTLKLKRRVIAERYGEDIEALYA
jgi:long-chain acyl-CoA synthetase